MVWSALGWGCASGALSLLARRRAWLGWAVLVPLFVVVRVASPSDLVLAGVAAGTCFALGPTWRSCSPALTAFVCAVTACVWGLVAVAMGWGNLYAPELWLFVVAFGSVASCLPLRWLGAPRWLSNPLAASQERALFVLHAVGRGSDLAVTAWLGLTAGLLSTLPWGWTEGGGFVLVVSLFVVGRRRELALRRRLARSQRVRVAAISVNACQRDVAAFVESYRAPLQHARDAGAKLIVLPEVAFSVDPKTRDAWFAVLSNFACEANAAIVAGFHDGLTRQNMAVVIAGSVRGEYEKQHPGPHEPKRHARMPPLLCRALELPPLSVVICVDLDYADLIAPVRRAGGLLLCPANDWPGLEELHHRAAVWSVVATGLPLIRSTGHGVSAIFDPTGRVLQRCSSPAMLVADVPILADEPRRGPDSRAGPPCDR